MIFKLRKIINEKLIPSKFINLDQIPEVLKIFLISIYNKFASFKFLRKNFVINIDDIHQYWRSPTDDGNLPEAYIKPMERSKLLLYILKSYGTLDAKILEIGCNVGRNLNYLFQAGFKNLEAIEISENAIKTLKDTYPKMADNIKIYNTAIEDIIGEFKNNKFDIVFTMAVLQHIHPDSEWIFSEISRITNGLLITIEDEHGISWRHFPRNYKKVFKPFGMKQIKVIKCCNRYGLHKNFYARIFHKPY